MALGASRDPDGVNSANWLLVTIGNRDASLLDRAERAQRDAVAVTLKNAPEAAPMLIDTHAWLRFRLGAIEDAIALERRAFTLEAKPEYATALGRFLRARVTQPTTPKVDLTRASSTPEAVQLNIDAGPHERPRVLYVDLAAAGLLRVVLPAGKNPFTFVVPAEVKLTGDARLLLMDDAGPELDGHSETKLVLYTSKTTALP